MSRTPQARSGLVPLVLLLFVFAHAGAARAATRAENERRIEMLEEQLKVLAEELESLRTEVAVPEEKPPPEGSYGLAPAASKVYQKERGLSLGGYGEVRLRAPVADDKSGESNVFDAVRAILYAGYKFNETFVLNGEFEFEHAGTGGGGSVSVEFLTLDAFLHPAANLRAGLVLVPMGFVNEIHEPVFFYGNERPEPERVIMPSTWRENGFGIFGEVFDRVSYRAYMVNGLDASGFSAGGLRGGRQKGSRALSDHFAFVFRTDVDVYEGLVVGGSIYHGRSGQNQSFTRTIAMTPVTFEIPDTPTTIYELHAQYQGRGFKFRALWVEAFLGDSFELSNALGTVVAQQMYGAYVEAGYDVFQLLFPNLDMSLEPFYRFERFDTNHRVAKGLTRDHTRDVTAHVAGLHFKPHPQVVIKLDYRSFNPAQGIRADEVQAGFGYVF